tara:strand:+ start:952 stop:1242 length:291 start_codon:yes stop_codon:yes gene_type:complete
MANEGYKELIEKIVKSKIRIFGNLAREKVNSVSGIKIDHVGNIASLSGNPKKVIKSLLDKFETIAGKASTFSAKTETIDLRKKYPDLDLPEELKSD